MPVQGSGHPGDVLQAFLKVFSPSKKRGFKRVKHFELLRMPRHAKTGAIAVYRKGDVCVPRLPNSRFKNCFRCRQLETVEKLPSQLAFCVSLSRYLAVCPGALSISVHLRDLCGNLTDADAIRVAKRAGKY
ncbi:hypothetical protein OAG68_01290 [bacterium]|nr:hypothetical protein [bacterium]